MIAAGADFGFSRNSSTLVIGHREPTGQIVIDLVREWRPRPGAPLRPSVVFASCGSLARFYGADAIEADVHYREAAREAWDPLGVVIRNAPTDAAEPFLATRLALVEDYLTVPTTCGDAETLRRLRSQMLLVKASDGSAGGMRITMAQTKDGAHGDIVSALVIVVNRLRPRGATGALLSGRRNRSHD